MEDVCIVCNRAIVWSSEELDANKDTQASASSTRSNGTSSPVSANNRQAASNPGQAKASSSSNNGAPSATSNNGDKQHHTKDKKSLHTHAHHHAVRGHHHARIKRNQSHGKLHTKSGIKPLTSTASSTAIAANAAAISAAVDAIVGTNGANQHGSTEDTSDAITSENLPDWMAIYCSEECRNEDELRSRLSFANLNEERERSLSKLATLQAQSPNGHINGLPGRAYSNASLSPTFGPQGSGGNRGPHSPWYNDSEGSEFDWHQKEKDSHQHAHGQSSSPHASRHRATSSRDSSDIIATSGSEGRRFSDASDSSRLSSHHRHHLRHAPVPTLHNPHARRSSSRTRGSNDSLASLGSSHYDYSSSGGNNGRQLSRPDIGHRSNSALGGLRAMTPIHHQQQTTSTSASPRLTSPNRIPSSSKLYPTATSPTISSHPRGEVPAPSTSSGTTASILIRSNSSASASNNGNNANNNAENGSASGSLSNLTSSTFIAPSSARTFRPGSISKSASGSGFLKPSKSSATLALSPAEDIRATMVAERTSSHSPARRPANAMLRNHSHHQHHRTSHYTSTSSIPYLSCSPSSPGSGSINSGRSNVSTDPSSSSVRGENEYYDDYAEGDVSDDGEYKPLPRKSEDDERNGGTATLASYGLFYQRTPSTPSLPSLAHQYSSSYGRSPPVGPHSFGATRGSRLSASFDTKNIDASTGSTTISSVFRERQNNSNRPVLGQNSHSHSSTLRMTPSNGVYSPRRATFDINAAYQNPQHPTPVRNHSSGRLHPPSTAIGHHQADNTPTQSGLASRSHSFVGHYGRTNGEPPHEVVHQVAKDQYGRTRAPSITRTDLERVASDRSISSGPGRTQPDGGVETSRSSSSTLQRLPSHLRPSTLSPRNSNDLALPSPPISPGLYNYNSRNGSHSAMNQLVEDGGYGRPLLASARSKSRSSFTWDHLPPYVPQYAALDLDKVRRNKSGTSLHSVYEDDSEQQNISSVPSSTQSTLKSAQQASSRKRLFYFPEAE